MWQVEYFVLSFTMGVNITGAAVDFPKNQSIAKLISSLYKQGESQLALYSYSQ